MSAESGSEANKGHRRPLASEVVTRTGALARWLTNLARTPAPALSHAERVPLRVVPDGYAGSITNEELNRPRRDSSEFTAEELAETASVIRHFERRRAAHRKASPDFATGPIKFLGATAAGLGGEGIADWRELLPEDHPQRLVGPRLVVPGTPEADESLAAAHDALLAAMRTTHQ